MKRILLICILYLLSTTVSAQKDSIEVIVDTLTFNGIVVDESENPLKNLRVKTLYSKKETVTDDGGNFIFRSLNANERIMITVGDRILWENVKGSRFIKFKVKAPTDFNLNMQSYGFREYEINAKRAFPKTRKIIENDSVVYPFDFEGHFNQPSYAGGLEKFYKYLIQNIIYPEKAIKNNVEGLVKISFVIKKNGGFGDIEIIRDIGFGCAEEVIRVLKMTEKKWNPANDMTSIDQRIIFEIPFKLKD
ncbi:energy transducer TonB [Nubsella zeaxanthinifaciens]|jgi:hypothetical protein|uniref:energy transducer TonB n=1 Tax=Nubsella zeaxanthinifaciens TaxID=392412 RepID=UPI000DE42CBF|nr:energy transducer TonB [Nubsella zeaxanthinifaciens]